MRTSCDADVMPGQQQEATRKKNLVSHPRHANHDIQANVLEHAFLCVAALATTVVGLSARGLDDANRSIIVLFVLLSKRAPTASQTRPLHQACPPSFGLHTSTA
jgi:hypothetical protein